MTASTESVEEILWEIAADLVEFQGWKHRGVAPDANVVLGCVETLWRKWQARAIAASAETEAAS